MKEDLTVEKLQEMWDAFILDATKQEKKGNKSAGRRARLKSIEIRESLKEWRKNSL